VEARNEVLNTAKREADAIKRQAAERARQLISQEDVLRTARQKAGDIVQAAENKARDLRRTASEYVDNALKRAEETLGAALTEMRSSRTEFRAASDKRDPA
jgi:vacuolar-type H+-ATPase subunit H